MKESLKIVTADGFKLSANRFDPVAPNGKVVLINSATGVKQKYYADFAGYLAEQGFVVYTYDYRGIGGSRPKSMRKFQAEMSDWGTQDYHVMLQNIFQSHPKDKVIVVGHSVGGQLVGLSPLTARVHAVIMVAAQTPYYKNYHGTFLRLKLIWFWFILIPVLTRLVGFFPASWLGLFEDLPRGVAVQWARWAKSRDYMFNDLPDMKKQLAWFTSPALMLSFSDDELAPAAAVFDLIRKYESMRWEHRHVSPEMLMQRKIGHFGFFRRRIGAPLWQDVVQWMHTPTTAQQRKAA